MLNAVLQFSLQIQIWQNDSDLSGIMSSTMASCYLSEPNIVVNVCVGLVTQWNRVNLALTSRLLAILYGPSFPVMAIPKVLSHIL